MAKSMKHHSLLAIEQQIQRTMITITHIGINILRSSVTERARSGCPTFEFSGGGAFPPSAGTIC